MELDGEPVPARVVLSPVGGSIPPGLPSAGRYRTDDGGAFRIEGLPEGRHDLAVLPPAGVEPWRTSVEAVAGETAHLEVDLSPGSRSLSGRVFDGRGIGIEGATVSAQRKQAQTSASGHYRIEGLASGSFSVSANPPGWRRQQESIQIAGPSAVLDFEFVRVALEGLAEWGDGQPVGGSELLFSAQENRQVVQRTRTDERGAFRVQLEEAVYSVEPVPTRTGYHTRTSLQVDRHVSDHASGAVLRFDRIPETAGIEGRIRGLAEEDVHLTEIMAFRLDVPDRPSPSDLSGLARLGRSTVEADGRYRIDLPVPGIWKVIAVVDGARRRLDRTVRVDRELVEMDLVFERQFSLTGAVRLGGEPLAWARLVLYSPGDPPPTHLDRQARTGRDGSFRFHDVTPGEYLLLAGASEIPVRLNGDEHIAVDLGAGRLEGVVREPETLLPLANVSVHIRPDDAAALGFGRSTHSNQDGEFVFEHVPEGRWTLSVPNVVTELSLQVAPGAVSRIDLP